MWYEILINGYTWFINELTYSSSIKLSEKVGGELTEGHYTSSEMKQIRQQVRDYELLGYNSRLTHLDRSGVTN